MSIKRQVRYKYQDFKSSVQTMALPAWFMSPLFRLSLFGVIAFFGIAYILNMTSAATNGYQIQTLQTKADTLETEVQKIEVEIAEHSSISSIAKRVENLNMVESANMKHFTLKNNAVAKN
jgi:cell division protein YceG involved in septum cleavage